MTGRSRRQRDGERPEHVKEAGRPNGGNTLNGTVTIVELLCGPHGALTRSDGMDPWLASRFV